MIATVTLIIILLLWYYLSIKDLVEIHLPGRGETYMVTKKYNDSQKAAELLSQVNENVIDVLRHMKTKYVGLDGSMTSPKLYRGITESMLYNYNPEVIVENTPGGADTSYTLNKGKKMYICIRDRSGRLLDSHTVTFVTLHELAHIGHYYGWGHGQTYWEVFKFVLKNAAECGVHQPTNYAFDPRKYCGISITYNPYFDSGIKNI